MVGEMISIVRELEQVQDRLTSLAQGEQAQKSVLLDRQEELRTQAARLAVSVDSRSATQDLLVKLAYLRRQLVALDRQHTAGPSRVAYRTSPMTGSGSRVEQRINRIERILADRGIRIR